MIIGKIIEKFVSGLAELYSTEEARNITFLVIEKKLGIKRHQILLNKDQKAEHIEKELNQILNELKTGKPVQYVLGETEFCGLKLKVNEHVLIPRPETEELVYWIKESISVNSKILDIGTGSGCIAIALKHFLPEAEVYALDVSDKALDVARKNSFINNCEVHFFTRNILKDDLSDLPQFNVIVSNPPYVTNSEKDLMHKNVVNFEPQSGLFVPDDDPLIFYKRITEVSKVKLKTSGYLFFEINEQFGAEINNLLLNSGFSEVEIKKDMQGKQRMVRGVF